jgi:hypothetical protein
MKLTGMFLFPLLFISFYTAYGAGPGIPDDPDKQILAAITAGDAQELSQYLNSMVDLGIPGNEGTYGKVQATRILEDFFRKNPVQSAKINKQGNSSDGSFFSLGEMQAGVKHYRLYYLLKNVNGKNLIHLLQIQENK